MRTDTTGTPRVEGRGQVCEYIEHLRATSGPAAVDLRRAHTLRVRIHADSHRPQSHGTVERWDGAKWHQVVYVEGDALAMDTSIGYQITRPRRPRRSGGRTSRRIGIGCSRSPGRCCDGLLLFAQWPPLL
jgi:hypothetical protein